jgi:hypothetical protein
MSYVTEEGFVIPPDTDGQSYPPFESKVPALRSFHLKYTFEEDDDIQINRIEVMAGGMSEDINPNADLSPANIPDGRLHAILYDKDPDDDPWYEDPTDAAEKFFYKVSHSLLDFPGVRRFQIRDLGCVGECVQKLPMPGLGNGPGNLFPPIFALVGFKLFFIEDDHHLDRIGVWFEGRDLHVAMRDKNADDNFGYLVDYIVIPTVGLNVSKGAQEGRARGKETIRISSIPNTDFVLTGWDFNFVSQDNHIRDLGVELSGDDLTVFYADKELDDEPKKDLFDWRVEWAQVGERKIGTPP